MNYTSGSLFTGGGGADIGLSLSGFKPLWGIERDVKIARHTQSVFPDIKIINRCVGDINPTGLVPVDLLWMSPPCQQYSVARRGDLADHQDKDAGLYCLPYLTVLMPRWVILENVPGYATAPTFLKILAHLKRLGYRSHWLILDAADHGVPQHRKRLILWAVREGERLPFFPQAQPRKGWYQAIAHLIPELPDSVLADWQIKRLREIEGKLSGISLVDVGKNTSRTSTVKGSEEPSFTMIKDHVNSHSPLALIPKDSITPQLIDLRNRDTTIRDSSEPSFTISVHRHKSDEPIALIPRAGANIKDFNPRLESEPSPTIRAMKAGRHTHWADILANNLIKQITPKATALLQSFPESYPLPESKTLAQQIIGNAVPPLLAKELGLAILKSIN